MTSVDPATVEALRAQARAETNSLPDTTYPTVRPPVARCRSCHRPVWWRVNPSGKKQPMDYDLVTATATQTPHHATCPNAADWRRR